MNFIKKKKKNYYKFLINKIKKILKKIMKKIIK